MSLTGQGITFRAAGEPTQLEEIIIDGPGEALGGLPSPGLVARPPTLRATGAARPASR